MLPLSSFLIHSLSPSLLLSLCKDCFYLLWGGSVVKSKPAGRLFTSVQCLTIYSDALEVHVSDV